VAIVIVALLLVATILYLSQRRLLHHPGRQTSAELEHTLAADGAVAWPSVQTYRGARFEPAAGRPKATVLVFHGNSGLATNRRFYADRLTRLGYRVILLEYPGYGPRRGSLGEVALVRDGVESVRRATEEFGAPIYILGESLGAGVAAAVVRETPGHVAGLVLVTPWDSLPDLLEARAWSLPIGLLARDHYDSVANLQGFQGPLAIVRAENDDVIPSPCTMRLYHSFTGAKRLFTVDGAGHIGWQDGCDKAWWEELIGWAEEPKT
jgi:pimeloyl-ACP methyl ester carboxylesterase